MVKRLEHLIQGKAERDGTTQPEEEKVGGKVNLINMYKCPMRGGLRKMEPDLSQWCHVRE